MSKRYDGLQPDFMTNETYEHFKLVRDFPLYWETRSWHPVLVARERYETAVRWLDKRAVRGTPEARNDWLHPLGTLFLIRDSELAVEFKMKFA